MKNAKRQVNEARDISFIIVEHAFIAKVNLSVLFQSAEYLLLPVSSLLFV